MLVSPVGGTGFGKGDSVGTWTGEVRWGRSRARETRGWLTCTLREEGRRVSACNGGGYDLLGTVLGDWVVARLGVALRRWGQPWYGLRWHDPLFNPGSALVAGTGATVTEREASGESLGLERYQAVHSASSSVPTDRHTVPTFDGAVGKGVVQDLVEALGGELRCLQRTRHQETWVLTGPSGVEDSSPVSKPSRVPDSSTIVQGGDCG
jgi:hypothetical protein